MSDQRQGVSDDTDNKTHGLVMLKKLVAKAVQEKVGKSRVVDKIQEAYDYIIVGAGAAGNVLAARLTEDADTNVLLLEAGGDDAKNPNVHMPISSASLQSTPFNWNYKSEPQTGASKDLRGQKISYPRGRGLGGSSSINFMLYNRGSRWDYDDWAARGCTGWSYTDVLPYFIKAEDNSNPNYVKTGYHGKGGPMKVSDLTMTPLVNMFLQAAAEIGHPVGLHNSPNNIGFANGQGNLHEGMRWSTAHGYLRPAMTRDNLHVAIGAQVQRILIANKEATGLDLTHDEKPLRVQARKEVIICAGAIESPKILMLSGIGPADHLTELNIPVVANLPVGENMQDHPMCMAEYKIDKPVGINVDNTYDTSNRVSKEYMQYLFFTSGYLGIPIAQAAAGFLRSSVAPSNSLCPDLQIQMGSALAAGLLRKTWNLEEEEKYLDDPEGGKPGIILSSYVLHPESSGTVKLRNGRAGAKPLIDPNFFSSDNDVKTQMEGMTTIMKLGQSQAFRTAGAHLAGAISHLDHNDRDGLEDFVRRRTMTSHHVTSTCKMGSVDDPTAVVDPELRVMGVKGLRVVDASVMPKITSGATSAPTIMIAERCADFIRGTNSVSHIALPPDVAEEGDDLRAVAP